MIGGIAEQTKILALNAAIEAARAGEAGQGFSGMVRDVQQVVDDTDQRVAAGSQEAVEALDEFQGAMREVRNLLGDPEMHDKAALAFYGPGQTQYLLESAEGPAQLCKGAGCEACRNTGYKGRQAIYEVMIIDETFHAAIVDEAPTTELEQIARAGGMKTMLEDGVGKALCGLTTIEEVLRSLPRLQKPRPLPELQRLLEG